MWTPGRVATACAVANGDSNKLNTRQPAHNPPNQPTQMTEKCHAPQSRQTRHGSKAECTSNSDEARSSGNSRKLGIPCMLHWINIPPLFLPLSLTRESKAPWILTCPREPMKHFLTRPNQLRACIREYIKEIWLQCVINSFCLPDPRGQGKGCTGGILHAHNAALCFSLTCSTTCDEKDQYEHNTSSILHSIYLHCASLVKAKMYVK